MSSNYPTLLEKVVYRICHQPKSFKWYNPSQNLCPGDLVLLQEESIVPTKWPLARVVKVHHGRDGFVQVATVKTKTGLYTRPATKLALLMERDPTDNEHSVTEHQIGLGRQKCLCRSCSRQYICFLYGCH